MQNKTENTSRMSVFERATENKIKKAYFELIDTIMWPVFFSLYTTPLRAIISSFDINRHLYADDTHI